jgi:hypothetical protein
VPLAEPRQNTVREEVTRLYKRRLGGARRGQSEGICSREHVERQLARLRAGQTVQLHRFGEVSSLPPPYRPAERSHSLYELRGDRLVPVPPRRPGCVPPREWTAPVTPDG